MCSTPGCADSLYGLVEPLLAVCCQSVSLHFAPQEQVDLPLEGRGAGEEPRRQPQQLPPSLLTRYGLGSRQLFDNLAVRLVTKRLLNDRHRVTGEEERYTVWGICAVYACTGSGNTNSNYCTSTYMHQRMLKYLISELSPQPHLSGWIITHVLHNRWEESRTNFNGKVVYYSLVYGVSMQGYPRRKRRLSVGSLPTGFLVS